MKPHQVCIPLKREDWDFSDCPPGVEWYCFQYEFGREVPHLFTKDDGSLDAPCWFGDTGFPGTPFLLSEAKPLSEQWEFRPRFAGNKPRSVGFGSSAFLRAVRTKAELSFYALLAIDWTQPDKRLVKDFGEWLKESRPLPATERRGKGSSRPYLADLKALGALRLLRAGLSAAKAKAFTKAQSKCGALYQKESDWYAARKYAEKVLDDWFRGVERGFWKEDHIPANP